MKYAIGFLLFALFFSASALADQLIVKEAVFRGGNAYVLDVGGPKTCIETITNLSNIYRYSGSFPKLVSNRYFIKEFTCVRANGTISEHGYMVQVPYSKEGKMCLEWGEWSGPHITSNCKENGFTTRATIINNITLKDFVKQNKQ